jgi:hypothetical protein
MPDKHAEFMRTLRLFIAIANLHGRAMKASLGKNASPEFSKQYQEAVSHLGKAADAMKSIADKLQPPKPKK